MSIATHKLLHDLLFSSILAGLSLILISFYFHAQIIDTHYPDWMVHAFRIKALAGDGLASWTHVWANGINLWLAYQFVPHLLTLGLIKVTGVSIARGMVLATIILFIFLRVSIYFLLRKLHFSPITSFTCAILSLDIAQYWGGVSDFSLLFGFSFFPYFLFLWIKYYQGAIQFLWPYLIGISFYIHPILGYLLFLLWIVGLIFSKANLLSLKILTQAGIFLLSSILFCYPILIKTSYLYTNPLFADKYFLSLVISSYQYFGLSIFILGAFFLSAIRIFMPFSEEYKWVRILFLFLLGYFILIVLGLTINLPKAIAQLQFTRGVTILGFGILFVFAPVLENLFSIKSRFIKTIIVFIFSIAVVEGMWFTSEYSPEPSKDKIDAVAYFNKIFPQNNITSGRIWSSAIEQTSYYAPQSVRLPYSYMGHLDSNQISPRISPLILYQPYIDSVPYANIERLDDYFKISGTQYLFFDETSPFTTTLLSSQYQIYKDLGVFKTPDTSYHIFEVPWDIRNAVAIDPSYDSQLKTFPFSLQLSEVNGQILLDDYVKKFTTMLYAPKNISLPVIYPSAETIAVKIPSNLKTSTIYLDESFDASWQGYFNNKNVSIHPTGPNFMKITLPEVGKGGILFLRHSWAPWYYIGWFFIVCIPIELLAFTIASKRKLYA